MGKKIVLSLVILVLILSCVVITGLWGSRGGLSAFLSGQMVPGPDLTGHKVKTDDALGWTASADITIDELTPIHRVAPEFISFAIDSSQIVGGKWWNPKGESVEMGSGTLNARVFDFNRPRLDLLTRALAPAYLRIGGSEADKIYYDMSGEAHAMIPEGYHSVMTRGQWDDVNAFAARNDLKLVFTINVGPSARSADGAWNPENLETLLSYSAERDYKVALWEMGNELNLYWYIYGPNAQISAAQYHKDLLVGKELVDRYYPDAMFAGQGSAFWPVLGEPLTFYFSFMADYMALSGSLTDVVSWHYYPQQSRRGLIASRRATPSRLLNPDNLNEAAHWGGKIRELRDQHAKGKPVWLGETGNAQFGGEPGVSDRYLAGLWWLDQLGLLARTGHDVIVRQTLSGMDYGMIDPDTLAPAPDYWNSLLWKRFMGRDVYSVRVEGSQKLRGYAHGHPDKQDVLSLLLINLDHESAVLAHLPDVFKGPVEVVEMGTDDIFSKDLYLNGKKLELIDDTLPEITGRVWKRGSGSFQVKPLTCVFLTVRI